MATMLVVWCDVLVEMLFMGVSIKIQQGLWDF